MIILNIRISTEFTQYRQLREKGWKVKWIEEGRVCLEENGPMAIEECPRGPMWWALYGSYGIVCPDCPNTCEGREHRTIE